MADRAPQPAVLAAPSEDVRDEALRRAEALAEGLFPHQIEGVAFLLGRRRAILADDMGLGKTRQSILAMTEAEPDGPWLVVCPASVKRNWQREIRWARPGDRVHLVGPDGLPPEDYTGWAVINYDILGRHIDGLLDIPWAGLVFDEAHYLKNHKSQRSRNGRRLAEEGGDFDGDPVIHALTGTPLTNRPRDLFALLQLVRHPMARSFLTFAKRYCDAHHNGYGWVTDGASNLDELRAELHGVMLRRTKDEVLDLPPKVRSWLEVDVPAGTALRETRAVVRRLVETGIARAAAKERTARDGGPRRRVPQPRRRGGDDRVRLLADLQQARHRIAAAKVPRTIEFVEGAVEQGEKVLVFSSFAEPVERIAEHFLGRSLRLTGSTPTALRQSLVDRFQHDDDVRVFVSNLVAGGVGLNLTAARQVVFNDLDWVPANHWQAEDRAYRIGQRGTVNISYFVARGTVDEFVSRALAVKAQLIDAVVEGTGAAPAEGDLLEELSALVASLSPRLEELSDDAAAAADPVERFLRDAVRAYETQHAGATTTPAGRQRRRTLSKDAIEALARVLRRPAATRYRLASGSRAGVYYELEADGPDVTCSCPGFEYRGACKHARTLKAALASGAPLPPGVEPSPVADS